MVGWRRCARYKRLFDLVENQLVIVVKMFELDCRIGGSTTIIFLRGRDVKGV